MGITGEYYRKSAGNSVRDRPAPVTFDPRCGSRGRFPLMSLRLRATLARVTQGSILPVKTAKLDGPRRSCVAPPAEDRCAESGALLR